MYNPRDVKTIKEIVDWLNNHYTTNSGRKLFMAYFEKADNMQKWHVGCEDMFIYMSEDYKDTLIAIKELYPNVKIIFCYLYSVWAYVLQKRKETVEGKAVILIK